MDVTEYNYDELIEAVSSSANYDTVFALVEWFERYGRMFWSGEFYNVPELNTELKPIYSEQLNENDGYDIIGWKFDFNEYYYEDMAAMREATERRYAEEQAYDKRFDEPDFCNE